jgi:uncharacterized protein (TIGR02147 family)
MSEFFEARDYREVIQKKVSKRGEISKLVSALKLDSGYVSRVLRGQGDLTPEQGFALANYFRFSELETRYFVLLVQYARAGTRELKEHHARELAELRLKASRAALESDPTALVRELSSELKSAYYSNWAYLAIGMATDIEGLKTIKRLAERFNLPEERVREILDFLCQHELCVQRGREYDYKGSTFLEKGSPIVSQHLTNWRLKAIEHLPRRTPADFHTTAVATVLHQDRKRVFDLVQKARADFLEIACDSKPETLTCFNLDWFEVS